MRAATTPAETATPEWASKDALDVGTLRDASLTDGLRARGTEEALEQIRQTVRPQIAQEVQRRTDQFISDIKEMLDALDFDSLPTLAKQAWKLNWKLENHRGSFDSLERRTKMLLEELRGRDSKDGDSLELAISASALNQLGAIICHPLYQPAGYKHFVRLGNLSIFGVQIDYDRDAAADFISIARSLKDLVDQYLQVK